MVRSAAKRKSREWRNSVDLIVEDETILIRPDPNDMALSFRADDLLQELVPKHRVRFLLVRNQQVRAAIKERGELWRISPLPKTSDEMKRMIGGLADRHSRQRVVLLQQGDRHAAADL